MEWAGFESCRSFKLGDALARRNYHRLLLDRLFNLVGLGASRQEQEAYGRIVVDHLFF